MDSDVAEVEALGQEASVDEERLEVVEEEEPVVEEEDGRVGVVAELDPLLYLHLCTSRPSTGGDGCPHSGEGVETFVLSLPVLLCDTTPDVRPCRKDRETWCPKTGRLM